MTLGVLARLAFAFDHGGPVMVLIADDHAGPTGPTPTPRRVSSAFAAGIAQRDAGGRSQCNCQFHVSLVLQYLPAVPIISDVLFAFPEQFAGQGLERFSACLLTPSRSIAVDPLHPA